jgi:hypothetical protein
LNNAVPPEVVALAWTLIAFGVAVIINNVTAWLEDDK